MNGGYIDTIRLGKRKIPMRTLNAQFIETDFGTVRVFDTQGHKPVILSAPDGPNVIEHHEELIKRLSNHFRVVCFEFPGVGFSFPTYEHDYSFVRSANIILQLMVILKIDRAALCFSCSNGFYAIKAAELAPEKFTHLFLSQTPSIHAMKAWTDRTIPKILTYPIIGQLVNSLIEKKMSRTWYKTALPKSTDKTPYEHIALAALDAGGCFCLSSLVQGLIPEQYSSFKQIMVPCTQVWGKLDYSHRRTDHTSILEHVPNCNMVVFENCGHFPELEATDNYIKLVNERL